MPEGGDANQQLQLAIARLLQHKGRTELPLVRERSGAAFGAADGWAVGQVYLRARLGRTATIEEISRRYQLPAAVLEPAFADADQTRLPGTAPTGGSSLTQPARTRSARSSPPCGPGSPRSSATGAPTTPQLAAALGDLATRFVEESPELTPQPGLAIAGGERTAGS